MGPTSYQIAPPRVMGGKGSWKEGMKAEIVLESRAAVRVQYATKHYRGSGHPIVASFQLG